MFVYIININTLKILEYDYTSVLFNLETISWFSNNQLQQIVLFSSFQFFKELYKVYRHFLRCFNSWNLNLNLNCILMSLALCVRWRITKNLFFKQSVPRSGLCFICLNWPGMNIYFKNTFTFFLEFFKQKLQIFEMFLFFIPNLCVLQIDH